MIQLLILALGLAGFLWVFQLAQQSWMNRVLAVILGLPILILFIVIAFFKISELALIPFLAKLLRTYFLDTTEKYQVNFAKDDPVKILIKKNKQQVKKDVFEQKWREQEETNEKIKKMQSSGLL